jgi:hypothetical protein
MRRPDYPEIDSPCPIGLSMPCAQKQAWCQQCQRQVHNLDALDDGELSRLLAQSSSLCVRYTKRVPFALALATGSAAAMASTGDALAVDADGDAMQMTELVMVGGASAQREAWESLFQELELPDNLAATTTPVDGAGEQP